MEKKHIILFWVIYLFTTGTCKYRRVCYHTNWSQYRNGLGRFIPEYIEPSLCTHLIYAFGKLQNNQLLIQEHNDLQNFKIFNDFKREYPQLKTLLAIGGWNAASTEFTTMVETASNRRTFISSTISFLRQNNFDGLDLDWEYPAVAKRGGRPQDKENFVLLVKELKEAFIRETEDPSRRLLLTAAVAAGKPNIDTAYNVPELAKYLDFISLMTYDLHGSWESKTGHQSALYPRSTETGLERQLNIEWAANYWVSLGAPKSLLNIGLATYGRAFRLTGSSHGLGAPTGSPPNPGKYTGESGFLSYYEICLQQSAGQGRTYRDTEHRIPYFVNDNLWVGYDDEQSIETKARWIVQEGYGGGMIWTLALDDFKNVCTSSNRKYPLTAKMAEILLKAENLTLPTPRPTEAPPKTTAGIENSKTNKQTVLPGYTLQPFYPHATCENKADGYHFVPGDCSKFMLCQNKVKYEYTCPGDLWWNQEEKVCDYQDKTICHALIVTPKLSIESATEHHPITSVKTEPDRNQNISSTNTGTNLNVHYPVLLLGVISIVQAQLL